MKWKYSTEDEKIIVDLEGVILKFDDAQRLMDWLGEQSDIWASLIPALHQNLTSLRSDLTQNIKQWSSRGGIEMAIARTNPERNIRRYVFTDEHEEGVFLERLAKEDSEAAKLLYPLLNGSKPKSLVEIRAHAAIMDFNRGVYNTKSRSYKAKTKILDTLIDSLRSRVDKIEGEYQQIIEAIDTNVNALQDNMQSEAKATRKRYSRHAMKLFRLGRNKGDEVAANVQTGIDELNAVKATYKEHMHLKAPVEYWEAKGTGHKTREEKAEGNLKWFFGLAAGFLIIVYGGGLLGILTNSVPLSAQVSLLFAGVSISSITLMIWIGRLLVRVYLSEKHLRMDAEERAVMVKTYLAMVHESVAAEADRNIILGSLFRPTEDGIVKDDAAPFVDISKMIGK